MEKTAQRAIELGSREPAGALDRALPHPVPHVGSRDQCQSIRLQLLQVAVEEPARGVLHDLRRSAEAVAERDETGAHRLDDRDPEVLQILGIVRLSLADAGTVPEDRCTSEQLALARFGDVDLEIDRKSPA